MSNPKPESRYTHNDGIVYIDGSYLCSIGQALDVKDLHEKTRFLCDALNASASLQGRVDQLETQVMSLTIQNKSQGNVLEDTRASLKTPDEESIVEHAEWMRVALTALEHQVEQLTKERANLIKIVERCTAHELTLSVRLNESAREAEILKAALRSIDKYELAGSGWTQDIANIKRIARSALAGGDSSPAEPPKRNE